MGLNILFCLNLYWYFDRRPGNKMCLWRPDRGKQDAFQCSKIQSDQPTNQLTNQPSNQQTKQPSNQATKQATNQASKQPSNQATKQPTKQATKQATKQPTNQPTSQASLTFEFCHLDRPQDPVKYLGPYVVLIWIDF